MANIGVGLWIAQLSITIKGMSSLQMSSFPTIGFIYGSEYSFGKDDDIVDTNEVQDVVQHLISIFPQDLVFGDTEVRPKLQTRGGKI